MISCLEKNTFLRISKETFTQLSYTGMSMKHMLNLTKGTPVLLFESNKKVCRVSKVNYMGKDKNNCWMFLSCNRRSKYSANQMRLDFFCRKWL